MRFMVIVKASRKSEAGALPTPELLAEMSKFNDELTKAGGSALRSAQSQGLINRKCTKERLRNSQPSTRARWRTTNPTN